MLVWVFPIGISHTNHKTISVLHEFRYKCLTHKVLTSCFNSRHTDNICSVNHSTEFFFNDVLSTIPGGWHMPLSASVLNVHMFHVCVIPCVVLVCEVGVVFALRGCIELIYIQRFPGIFHWVMWASNQRVKSYFIFFFVPLFDYE